MIHRIRLNPWPLYGVETKPRILTTRAGNNCSMIAWTLRGLRPRTVPKKLDRFQLRFVSCGSPDNDHH